MKGRFFRIADPFLYALILSLFIWMLFDSSDRKSEGVSIRIRTESSDFIYPLFQHQIYIVEGELGPVKIECSAEGARVIAAGCPGGDCMNGAPIALPGEWRACLPGRVMIEVEGAPEDSLMGGADAALY